MRKYYHRKLIRDNLPKLVKASGNMEKTKILGTKEFERELKKKLVEEAKELQKAPGQDVLNELADALELIKSIATHYKLPFSKVEKYQDEKRKKRGGFKKRLFLVWSTMPAGK